MVGGRNVRDFQFYVTDDRYAVRSLLIVTVMDESAACRIAKRILGEPHHHTVEVWDRDGRVFTLGETDRSPSLGS
jgi:hypothetical protein